jgi:sulfur carrier protein
MKLFLNGREQQFAALGATATLTALLAELGLKADRVAVEHNGEIVPRDRWEATALAEQDRLEIVHFVGGGAPGPAAVASPSA